MLPPSLRPGDTIGVMAPSSRPDHATIDRAIAELEDHGYRAYVHPQTWSEDGQSAGTAEDKAMALHDLLRDPAIDGIVFARGGNRAGFMLEHLDYRLIARHPKVMMGYSDVTVLLNAIYHKTGLVGFHGPLLQRFAKPLADAQLTQCFDLLRGKKPAIGLKGSRVLRPGKAHGTLLGGNLSVLCSMIGTKWQPRFDDSILFLEDIGDELSRYDRMFQQLRNAGILEKISGLLLGDFSDTKDTGILPFGFTLDEIALNALGGRNIPVVAGAPFGHGTDLYTIPVGAEARLTAAGGKTGAKLVLTGAATGN